MPFALRGGAARTKEAVGDDLHSEDTGRPGARGPSPSASEGYRRCRLKSALADFREKVQQRRSPQHSARAAAQSFTADGNLYGATRTPLLRAAGLQPALPVV